MFPRGVVLVLKNDAGQDEPDSAKAARDWGIPKNIAIPIQYLFHFRVLNFEKKTYVSQRMK